MSTITDAPLTMEQARRLAALEEVIRAELRSFADTGNALIEIRDSRLYRDEHDTFDDYCRAQFGFGRRYSYNLIEAAEVCAVAHTGDLPEVGNERVARELAPLLEEPEALQQTWEAAVAEHGPKVTAEQVKETRKKLHPPERRGDPERDTRFEMVEDAVALLQLLPDPEQCVFPENEGDVEALDEAVRWLADWAPRFAREWRSHRAALRRSQRG